MIQMRKLLLLHAGDRQADAIHGHRAFEHHVAHHLRRRGNVQHVVLPHSLPARDPANAVNVAGDEMPAQVAVRAQRPLQVDQRAGLGELQVRPLPGLLQQIELRQPGLAARGQLHHRQAAAVDRQARAHLQAPPAEVRPHGQLDGFRGRLDPLDRARFFNNSCKHGRILSPTAEIRNPNQRGLTRALSSQSGPSRRHSRSVRLRLSASVLAPSPATARRESRPPRIIGA